MKYQTNITKSLIESRFFFFQFSVHFTKSVGPIDHPSSMPMVSEFGGMTPESNFMNQNASNQGGGGGGVNGPGNGVNGPDHSLINGQRNGSPSEFMGSGNFSEPQNMQNEGLVW